MKKKQISVVRSRDDYGDKFWRLAGIRPMSIDLSRQIADRLNDSGVEAYAEIDKGRAVVHVMGPEVLPQVREILYEHARK